MAEDLISALSWVPRASVRSTPVAYEMSKDELSNIQAMDSLTMEDGEEAQNDNEVDEKGESKEDGDMEDVEEEEEEEEEENEEIEVEEPGKLDASGLPAELRMDDYDDEPETQLTFDEEREEREAEIMENFKENIDEEVASDAEDFNLKPDDKVLLAAHTEDDHSCLEVYVYDEETGSFYIHHDIMLPAFPLCMAWMGCGPEVMGSSSNTGSRNYVAVGTFHPDIEIWNVDVLDALEPNISLGGVIKKKSKKGKVTMKLKEGSHKDAVMGLSWNSNIEQLLASGSADMSAKLWDVSKQTCVHTWTHHTDKVQTVLWNPIEANILLSGSFDQTVAVFDARQAEPSTAKFTVSADVESVVWNPWNPAQFYVATEDGKLACYDVRSTDNVPVFSFQAHKEPASAVTVSTRVPGMLATSSMDKSVRIWDVKELKGTEAPKPITEKQMAIGPLFDCHFCVDDPFVLAAGGTKGRVAMWDTVDDADVDEVFSSRVEAKQQ